MSSCPSPSCLPTAIVCQSHFEKVKRLKQSRSAPKIKRLPRLCADIWHIGRKQYGLSDLHKGLEELGVQGLNKKMNGDELDAVTAALFGKFFARQGRSSRSFQTRRHHHSPGSRDGLIFNQAVSRHTRTAQLFPKPNNFCIDISVLVSYIVLHENGHVDNTVG